MSSTTKALTLLSYFSIERPEIGLSQLCRLAKRDKATTYRYLQTLESVGFIEQNPTSRDYRLGPSFMYFSQIREATVPRENAAKASLKNLADATGETAHVTVLSGAKLYGLCACESPRHAIRAIIDLHVFPLNATASGLCAVAFGQSELFEVALENPKSFTATTPTTRDELSTLIAQVRKTGFGQANKSYEDEIQGVAAPIFDHLGHLAGAVAVACVASRFNPALEQIIKSELIIAAREITRNWGGTIPGAIESAWTRAANEMNILEPVL